MLRQKDLTTNLRSKMGAMEVCRTWLGKASSLEAVVDTSKHTTERENQLK